VGLSITQPISITGGKSAYTCSQSGQIPGVVVLPTCTLSGIPTTVGTYSITVTAVDSSSPQKTGSATITLVVSSVATQRFAVLSGDFAVVGASVQVYAAGTAGNGSAPTALLSSPLTTDSTGAFVLPSITCPTATSIVYVVAKGGKAGTNGTVNSGISLMASPGACSVLGSLKSLIVNELTTVASTYGFAQFETAGGKIGAASTNLAGITLAAATARNLAETTTGTLPGTSFPTSTGTLPAAKINLLATLLYNCITSTAGAASTACTGLYAGSTVGTSVPSNTMDALLNLVKNPATGVAALYTLAGNSSALNPYTPTPASQPADWTLFINYLGGGMNDPTAVSVDSTGRVWVANYFSVASLFSNTGAPVLASGVTGNSLQNSYGGAVDATDNFWVANEEGGPSGVGTVTVLGPTGAPVSGSPYTQGGLNFPISVAFDKLGYGWIVDYGNSHLSILSSSGGVATGTQTSGYTTNQFIFPVAVAVDGNRMGWVANQSSNTVTGVSADGSTFKSYVVGSGPSGVAVDKNNNVWTANYYGDSVGLLSSAGVVVSGASGFSGGGINHPQGIATDGAGTVWVTNYRAPGLSQLAAATATTPGAPISPSAGWAPDAALLEAFGIAIDSAGNLWVTNFGNNTLTEFVGMAVPVKTPLIGPAVAP
jgi:streptogramin lyase